METSLTDVGKLQFRLENISVLHFSIVEHPIVSMDSGLMNLEFGFNFRLNTKDDIILCKMNIKFNLADDLEDYGKGASPVLDAAIQFLFKVINLKNFILTVEGKPQLNLGVLAHVISVAYSTSRGIIFERTRGYGVNGLPMPILNVEEYIDDVFVKLPNTTSETTVSEQRS